ncbi:hypothetical protein NP233_g4103 [Leucocoprinus birnbaumii]|uniref:Uncharacterized protein n=1 Tax=Leucocoprinus birnbaumii TaxID=56174 RepID=A0AAD5VXV3_9AGAR|nr:hypothetical protein NP233_g4103 [Leucocoprinus birnbaumii]
MTETVLFCIPVFYGVVVSLVFQLVVDAADGAWLFWWISRSHDDGIEPLKTLVGCSLALAIWAIYAAFNAVVGLYGALRRKRYMKNFWKPQAFVWICHIGVCIWYIVVYYQVGRDERVRNCKREVDDEDSEDANEDICEHLLGFRGAPLPYVWITFVVQTVIQTVVLYFLWQWRRVLNSYSVVEREDVANVSEGGHFHDPSDPLSRPMMPINIGPMIGHRLQPSDSSEVTLLGTMDPTARYPKSMPSMQSMRTMHSMPSMQSMRSKTVDLESGVAAAKPATPWRQ